MEQILAFWVHPRSISTAFERDFMERGDFGLDDKPNLRDYYDYHLPFYEKLFKCRITAA